MKHDEELEMADIDKTSEEYRAGVTEALAEMRVRLNARVSDVAWSVERKCVDTWVAESEKGTRTSLLPEPKPSCFLCGGECKFLGQYDPPEYPEHVCQSCYGYTSKEAGVRLRIDLKRAKNKLAAVREAAADLLRRRAGSRQIVVDMEAVDALRDALTDRSEP